MSDLMKALESRVSFEDWQRMARYDDVSPDELKHRLLNALQESNVVQQVEVPVGGREVSLSNVTQDGNCHSQEFSISLFDIVGVKGKLTLCGDSSSNWSADLQTCLIVAGASVWCRSVTFDPHHVSVCYNPDVGIAKAHLCFTLQLAPGKICLNLKGEACVWAFGWECGSFDVTPFCLPLP